MTRTFFRFVCLLPQVYPEAVAIFEWTQADPSCTPRPPPGWLGLDGTNVAWTDDTRSEWFDIVQGLVGATLV